VSYFNEDQRDHMRSLGAIPRELRCASGWHVTAREPCDCHQYYREGGLTRMPAARPSAPEVP